MSENGVKLGLVIAVIVIVSVISVICTSYEDLHFYEIGFTKSSVTGAVDTSKVYTGGRHWIGPTTEFKKFRADSHRFTLSRAPVFTQNSSLEIFLDVNIVYFLIPEDLKLLHDAFNVDYDAIIQSKTVSALKVRISKTVSALKNAAQKYKYEDFLTDRVTVQTALHAALQMQLGGTCCPLNCEISLCVPGCKPRQTCEDSDKGHFVDPRYFQILRVQMPPSVEEKFLKRLIQEQDTAAEGFRQEASVVKKETEKLVQDIRNTAAEITANATASAYLLEAQAQASYQVTLENARREGLKILYSSLNFTDAQHKSSFDYLRLLGDSSKAHLTVDFDQLITGPFTP